jgi:hypothetical protein
MSSFETHPKSLKDELLNLVHTREMALPDFQRDFVWQPGQTKSLIISLSKSFPAGSLLRIESTEIMFAPRAIATAPELNGHKPKYLILDGQQRLTSLYQALYGTGDHVYFVRLQKLIEGVELDEALFYERRERGEKRYGSMEKQARLRTLPLQQIFGGAGFYSWLDDIEEVIEADDRSANLTSKDRQALRGVYVNFIEPMVNYKFPVVTLPDNTSLEAVCTIFETLNSTGVRLSVFDLLSARYYAKGENLRELWANALANTKNLEYYGIDPYYILQMISAHTRNSLKRSDVLNLEADKVVELWEDATWGMDQALDMLHDECGVLNQKFLSYNTILIPLAVMFMQHRRLRGPIVGALRSKLKRWYWCAVLGQAYESSPTSQSITDINELNGWLQGGQEPQTVTTCNFERDTLFTTTTRQRAVYRGVLCLILRRPPLDFHSTKALTSGLIEEHRVDDHHIFPNAFLNATTDLTQREIDCILNRTLIDRQTNQMIGKKPPGEYIGLIEEELGSTRLEEVLASHYLPTGSDSTLRRDDFDSFRNERADRILELIREVTV